MLARMIVQYIERIDTVIEQETGWLAIDSKQALILNFW
jgi:hypothetical protein